MTINSPVQLFILVCCICTAAKAELSKSSVADRVTLLNSGDSSGRHESPATVHRDGPTSGSSDKKGSGPNKPNIIMIVADDLGWNDVDWRDKTMHTPVLAKLAAEGMVLNQSYVQPVCSPSRAAFMSGYYPYHLGLQHESLRATQKAYMPGNVTTLPQYLQKLGYRTHMAGKWHLGFCNWRYTPTYRGFDSFVGFYNAIQDYYTHIGHHQGYDFRHNEDVYYKAKGTYSAFIFTQYIEQVIAQHNKTLPLFVYLPYQSVHGPLQVPQQYLHPHCTHFHDTNRRLKCGMVVALDEGVGNITRALQAHGMYDNTLLFFTTDNGGPVHEGANNWPLRGSKTTLWEGGTRAMAFLHAPKLLKSGTVYDGVIHAVDWLPTLVEAAGGSSINGIDGVSQWQSLLQSKIPSARNEFVYNIDEMKNNSGLRQGRFKLLQGNPGHPDKWYPPPTSDFPNAVQRTPSVEANYSATSAGIIPQQEDAENMTMTLEAYDQSDSYLLYDLDVDPTEHHDVKDKYPDVFKRMRARLDEYRKSLVPANFPPHDPDALPSHFNGVWSPGWC